MALPAEFIDTLLSRNNIESVISGYMSLRRTGRNLVGLCPFHGEKTPSFVVYPENNSFYCFGCHVGGNTITFIQRKENLDYIEAVRFLAQRAGMELPEQSRQQEGMTKLRLRLYEANREAARYFYSCLYSPQGKEALDYLHGRQLSDATIRHFGLGYAPNTWYSLCNYLRDKGFREDELVSADLAIRSRQGSGIYDRFRNRVIFPIIDLRGNVLGFGGRVMDDSKPKYLNTSDTPIFNKGDGLFAMNFAKNYAKEYLILSEGYMDVIAMHQAGFEMATATLGTALTPGQALLMSRYVKEIVLCYDADEAGKNATARAIPILKKVGLQVRVLSIPDAKDPDEFIKTKGADRFRMLIEKSGNDVEYRLGQLRAQIDLGQADGKVQFLNSAIGLLASLENPIEQDVYLGKLAGEFGVEKATLMHQIEVLRKRKQNQNKKDEVRKIQQELAYPKDAITPERQKKRRSVMAQEGMLSYLLHNPERIAFLADQLPAEWFISPFYRGMYERMKQWDKNKEEISMHRFSAEYSVEEMSRITELFVKGERTGSNFELEKEYLAVLKEEANHVAVEDMVGKSDEEILQYISEMKSKKK